MVAVATTGLAGVNLPVNGPQAADLYPGVLNPLWVIRLGLIKLSTLPRRSGCWITAPTFYTMPESAPPAGLLRKKRTPVLSTTAVLGAAGGVASVLGLGHSLRGSWNPLSGAFWESRGKGTECSRNPLSSAYCGKSNPAKCSQNPLSRVYCGRN